MRAMVVMWLIDGCTVVGPRANHLALGVVTLAKGTRYIVS